MSLALDLAPNALSAATSLRGVDSLVDDDSLRLDIDADAIMTANMDLAFGRRDAEAVYREFGLAAPEPSQLATPLTDAERSAFEEVIARLRGGRFTNGAEAALYEAGGPEVALAALALAVAVVVVVVLW